MKHLLVFALSLAFASSAVAATKEGEFTRRLRLLYADAQGPNKLAPSLRADAALRYHWLSRAASLCAYSVESKSDCENALASEDSFSAKRFCVAAERKTDKQRCLKEGAALESQVEALFAERQKIKGDAKALNDFAKRVSSAALKASSEGSGARDNDGPANGHR